MSVIYQVSSEINNHTAASHNEAERLLEKGIEVLTGGDILSALDLFEKAFHMNNSPLISSYYAFCIAKERRQFSRAVALCTDAIKKDPQNPFHYLNLGRIHLLSNEKEDAAKVFREGLRYGADRHVSNEMMKLKTPETTTNRTTTLKKENPLGKYVGIFLKKLRLS